VKIKDIEIGKIYTNKNRASMRKVVSINDDMLTYKMMNTRYVNRIGKEYKWETKKFAQWANVIYSKDVIMRDFFKNPNENNSIIFKLKDEFTLEDFFQIDGVDPEDIKDFTVNDFKNKLEIIPPQSMMSMI